MFYTYAHYTPQGHLFYIGKGQGGRSHSFYGRNILWNEVVTEFGSPNVEILANWDTEEEALSHEVLLISTSDSPIGAAWVKIDNTESTQWVQIDNRQ